MTDSPIYAWIGVFMFPMLMIRYFTYERMLLAPAIYLRSFRDDQAGAVLGSLLVREATRYAPIVALTHHTQPPDQLSTSVRAGQMPRLFTTDDTTWQDWVRYQLAVCSFVMIDSSIGTDGVRWELQEIRKRLPGSRIVILARNAESIEPPDDIFLLRYELDRPSLRRARRQFRNWLSQVDRTAVEEIPANRRAELVPPQVGVKRPAIVTWFATIGLLIGGSGLLCNPLNAIDKLVRLSIEPPDTSMYAWSTEYTLGFVVFSLVGIFMSLLLLAACVGMLKDRRWGVRLGWVYAWLGIAVATAFFLFSFMYQILPTMQLASRIEAEQEGEFVGSLAATIVMPLLRFLLPALALFCLARLRRSPHP